MAKPEWTQGGQLAEGASARRQPTRTTPAAASTCHHQQHRAPRRSPRPNKVQLHPPIHPTTRRTAGAASDCSHQRHRASRPSAQPQHVRIHPPINPTTRAQPRRRQRLQPSTASCTLVHQLNPNRFNATRRSTRQHAPPRPCAPGTGCHQPASALRVHGTRERRSCRQAVRPAATAPTLELRRAQRAAIHSEQTGRKHAVHGSTPANCVDSTTKQLNGATNAAARDVSCQPCVRAEPIVVQSTADAAAIQRQRQRTRFQRSSATHSLMLRASATRQRHGCPGRHDSASLGPRAAQADADAVDTGLGAAHAASAAIGSSWPARATEKKNPVSAKLTGFCS